MKQPTRLSFRSSLGFTLLELLVVITIIGILASLAYVGGAAVMKRAKVVQAENQIQQLKNSIASYYTEYRRWPVEQTGEAESSARPYLTDEPLMNVLLGSDRARGPGGLNPRAKTFYSGRLAKRDGDGRYRLGLRISEDGSGELFDPWGNHFRVVFDLNHDSRLPAPSWSKEPVLPESIAIWSLGPETMKDPDSNNLTSW